MPNQKKQHYVPKCILKNFTVNKKFYVFNALKNTIIDKSVPYDDQCYTSYLYGKDGVIENYLKEQEDAIAPIIKNILEGQTLSKNEEIIIKQYIVIQHMRTEKMIDHRQNLLFNVLEQLIPIVAKSEGVNITKNEIIKYGKEYINGFNRTDIVNENIEMALKLLPALNDLHMVILRPKNGSFICSDHPVFLLNPFQPENGIGLMCAGLIVIMPISPQCCILLYDDYMYNFEIDNGAKIDGGYVTKINLMQYFYCKELLFSPTYEELKMVKDCYDQKYSSEVLENVRNLLTTAWKNVGINDPFLINKQVEELEKKSHFLEKIIPKTMLQEKFEGLNGIKIKDIFLPYVNDVNGNFSRNLDGDNIPTKYYYVGNDFVNVIKTYIQERERNNDKNNSVVLEE